MIPSNAPPQALRSLGTRLVLATLGFCFVFTVLAVGARTWSAWQSAVAEMDAELTLVERVYRQTLSKAIWEMDRDSLRAHVASAAQVTAVGRIVLQITSANRPPEIIEQTDDGWSASTLAPTRHSILSYDPFPGGRETVGELTLSGDERVLWDRLRGEVREIVIAQLLQSLLLAGLITLMFNRSVTVHVRHIARHLSRLTPDRLDEALKLERPARHRDELTLLEAGVNQLQDKLADHLDRLRRYESELADLVLARTAELESLSQAQQMVLSLSNRLIHAPYATFDDCQRDCLREVAQRLAASQALWLLPEPQASAYRVFLGWQADAAGNEEPPPQALPAPPDARLPARLERDELLFFATRSELGESLAAEEATAFAALPIEACALARLHGGGENFGFLLVGRRTTGRGWPKEDRALLAMTAQMLLHSARHKAQLLDIVAAQDALRAANGKLEELSRHDALTGLPNRRYFDEIKEDEFRRALRSGLPLTLMICDIDFFKNYNDSCGHAGGDRCLRAVAGAMRASITRSGDAIARVGGEEFAVLLPATREAAALKVAERIRQAVAALRIPHSASKAGPYVTISIGIAQIDFAHPTNFDALFEEADQALYRAKNKGRNRVEGAAAPAPNPA